MRGNASRSPADVTVYGYSRPGTQQRVLGTARTSATGTATLFLPLEGNTRLNASGGGCSSPQATDEIVTVQPRFGRLGATRNGPRDYTFSTFYFGPSKTMHLYRVEATGREVLTAQFRGGPEIVHVDRRFLGSGRFGFVLRAGTDINGLGAATDVRDTVIH